MFTTFDKALLALIMAVIWLVNFFFGTDIGVPQETISVIVGALTPILVWLWPNKFKPPAE